MHRAKPSIHALSRSSVEAYLFGFIGIAAVAFPMTWYFRSLLVVCLIGIVIDLIIRSPLTVWWPVRAKLFCGTVTVCLLASASWRPILEDFRGPELPEVKLRLVHPISPMIVLDNTSGVVARDIKKMIGIWNADDLRTYVQGSSGNDPLPIPISTFDVLRPHVSSGGEGVFQQSVNAGYIKPGNRLIGSIGVVCPLCSRGYTYFVYIIWGKEGWFSELTEYKEGEVVVPSRITKENLEVYFSSIERTPQFRRHPIISAN